jgi:type I restriction enzyme M protein
VPASIPQHVEGGELLHFDHVITNPPFSQNYSKADLKLRIALRAAATLIAG